MMRQKQLYSLSVLPKHKLPTQLHKGRPLPSSPLQSWCTCSQSQNWIWMDGSSLQYRGTETNANTRTRTELHQNSILCDSITHLCKIKGYNYAFCRRDSDQYSFFLFVRHYYYGLLPGTSFCRLWIPVQETLTHRAVRVKHEEGEG